MPNDDSVDFYGTSFGPTPGKDKLSQHSFGQRANEVGLPRNRKRLDAHLLKTQSLAASTKTVSTDRAPER